MLRMTASTRKTAPVPPSSVPPKSGAALPVIDWAQIEADYRAGFKPLRVIAEENGVSHTAIGKRARKEEWSRDLSAKIRAKADLLVSKSVVSEEVSKQKAATERQTIEANAGLHVQVRLSHRRGLTKLSKLRDAMLEEIDAQTTEIDLLTEIVEIARNPDDSGNDRRNDLLQKIISLPNRVDSLKKLAEVDEKIRKGEREAYGINPDDDNPDAPAAALTDAERSSRLASLLAKARKAADGG